MPELHLIGGPFDGACGPFPGQADPILYVAPDPAQRARNGLLLRASPKQGFLPYIRRGGVATPTLLRWQYVYKPIEDRGISERTVGQCHEVS